MDDLGDILGPLFEELGALALRTDPARAGHALRVDSVETAFPIALALEVDGSGAPALRAMLPTQVEPTGFDPRWHRIRMTVVADEDG